jgi:hypothetical protein
VKREAEKLIELITSWILIAFSAIAPIGTGARMGTVIMGTKAALFQPTFFPTSEFFSSFLTFILYTLSFNPRLSTRPFFEPYLSLLKMNLSLLDTILSLPEAIRSLSKAILSLPKRYLLSPGGELLHSGEGVSSAKACPAFQRGVKCQG